MKIICNDRLVLFYLFLIICFFSQRGGQVQGVKRVRQGNLLCAHDPQRGKKDQGTVQYFTNYSSRTFTERYTSMSIFLAAILNSFPFYG